MNRRIITDLSHAPTLAISIGTAFPEVASEYGVRLEGIEDDANEHNDFWLAVARRIIAAETPRTETETTDA